MRGHGRTSAVFYADDREKALAGAFIQDLDDQKVFGERRVVTTLEPLTESSPRSRTTRPPCARIRRRVTSGAWRCPRCRRSASSSRSCPRTSPPLGRANGIQERPRLMSGGAQLGRAPLSLTSTRSVAGARKKWGQAFVSR